MDAETGRRHIEQERKRTANLERPEWKQVIFVNETFPRALMFDVVEFSCCILELLELNNKVEASSDSQRVEGQWFLWVSVAEVERRCGGSSRGDSQSTNGQNSAQFEFSSSMI